MSSSLETEIERERGEGRACESKTGPPVRPNLAPVRGHGLN